MRKPSDFVVAPDPVKFTLLVWPSRMPADTVVIEFHQIGKMLTLPAAECDPTLAVSINTVGKSQFQNGFLWPVRNLHDTQRECVEIQYWPALMHQSAGRNMSIAQNHVPAGVSGSVLPDSAQQV